MATHTILGGKVHVYRRPNSRFWQCSSYLAGRNRRTSTKQESLQLAKEFAEDWYLSLRDKNRQGELLSEKTFKQAAAQFEREYEIITEGQRSPRWVEGHKARLRLHLVPFFGNMGLSHITGGKVQEYRIHRMTPGEEPNPHSQSNRPHTGKPPSRSTLHDEIVTLRQVLKTATGPGSATRNTSSSTRRPANARASRSGHSTSGRPSSFTILCCSWPIPACGRTRPRTLSTVTWRSSRTSGAARRSSRSRSAASAASAIA